MLSKLFIQELKVIQKLVVYFNLYQWEIYVNDKRILGPLYGTPEDYYW